MAGKLCNEGENHGLNVWLASTAKPANLYMGLYTVPTSEPEEDATMVDITEPGTFGYARQPIAQADWTVTDDLATGVQQIFTASGGSWGTVYGYFITTDETGTAGPLIFVEQFSDGPYTVNDGVSVKVTPKIRMA